MTPEGTSDPTQEAIDSAVILQTPTPNLFPLLYSAQFEGSDAPGLSTLNGWTDVLVEGGHALQASVGALPVSYTAAYLNDGYINASEKAQGVSVTWITPLIEGAVVVSYDVEFGTTPTFSPLVAHVDDVVGLSAVIPPDVMAADGVKYMQVRARYLAPTGVDSLPGAFTAPRPVTVDTSVPLPPVLTAPIGTIVTNRTPTLTFAPSATAARYQLELDLSGAFNPTLFTASPTTPSVNIPNAQALTNGLHYWRAQAVDAAGNVSGFSAVGVFLVMAP